MSQPCRFSCVGSCLCQKTSSSCSYDTCSGSYVTSTTSAWPVVCEQTSSYVGLSSVPPEYPTRVSVTPSICRNAASTPQKQPAPNVAFFVTLPPIAMPRN